MDYQKLKSNALNHNGGVLILVNGGDGEILYCKKAEKVQKLIIK
jgi:hypothetical protein